MNEPKPLSGSEPGPALGRLPSAQLVPTVRDLQIVETASLGARWPWQRVINTSTSTVLIAWFGMAKKPFNDYADEIAYQRHVWSKKASLRAIYLTWYERIVSHLSPNRPVVEIGSGCGNFKSFFPDAIATDAFDAGPWIDQVVDARNLPFEPNSIGNLVLVDVLHHLPRPIGFLRSAAETLQVGGRIVLVEPAATPWAKRVLGLFHHEPVDMEQDVFGEFGKPEPPNEGFTFANQAIASLLFVEKPAETMALLPTMSLLRVEYSDFIVYPATGGFSYLNLMPSVLVEPLQRLERLVTDRTGRTTAMRLMIVLERTDQDADA